jgi:DNA-binding beta-propeller fold protein YncE
MKGKYHSLAALALALAGCRGEAIVAPAGEEQLTPQEVTSVTGFYLLNEGNMNTNKASLDYHDYATGIYRRDVYGEANPTATLGLGDVGNDLGVYGAKLYAVINCSNKVEVMDAKTARRLKVINVKNCRYVTFARGKAYVSAYDGAVLLGAGSPNGFVAEIDTATLEVTRAVGVGRQPEEMAVVGNYLYVANSGGYSPPDYETTLSVIDLETFARVKDIDIAINLHRVRADAYGDLYVSSRGDYYTIPSNLFLVDTRSNTVKKAFNVSCANLAVAGDTAYVIGSEYSYVTARWTVTYSMIDVKSETRRPGSFLPAPVAAAIKMPYGIAVDPDSRDIYITDAADYVTPGTLYRLDRAGNVLSTVTTGDIPAHFAFTRGRGE